MQQADLGNAGALASSLELREHIEQGLLQVQGWDCAGHGLPQTASVGAESQEPRSELPRQGEEGNAEGMERQPASLETV